MRKGQLSVIQRAGELNLKLTADESKLLMNEKYKVSFYQDLLVYIRNLREHDRVLSYEEMLCYVDLIYEIYEELYPGQQMFFFYNVSEEEEKTSIWLLQEHRDLLFENFENIEELYSYARSDKEVSVKSIIDRSLTLEEPSRYIMIYAYLINKSNSLQLTDDYATVLSLDDAYESLLRNASRCIENNLDIVTAKKCDYNYGQYLYDMYKDKRECLCKYYPLDISNKLYATVYKELNILSEEDKKKADIIKDLNADCYINTLACEERYKYSPTGLSVTLDYYNQVHTYDRRIYSSSGHKVASIEVLFLFTTEFPISVYIKKYGKWIPATAKDLAKYCSEHSGNEMMHLLDCIENVFITHGSILIKDVMKYIRSGRFIPPLIMNDVYQYTSFSQLFEYKYPCPKNWNKNDINALYCAYKLRKYIEPTHQNLIFEVVNKKLLDNASINNISFRRRNNIRDALVKIVSFYLSEKTKANYEDVRDYVSMCYLSGEKIKLGLKSRRKLIEEHNRIARTYNGELKSLPKNQSLVKKDSKFTTLRNLLPKNEFEWIKKTGRLDLESAMQHNCVWSYADLIKNDKCAIYHFVYKPEGIAYTIEFNILKNGSYKIVQMQKSCNEGHSKAAYDYVNSFIKQKAGKNR